MRNLRLSTDYVRSFGAQRLIVRREFVGSHPPTGGMAPAGIDIQHDANPRVPTKRAYRADGSFRGPQKQDLKSAAVLYKNAVEGPRMREGKPNLESGLLAAGIPLLSVHEPDARAGPSVRLGNRRLVPVCGS